MPGTGIADLIAFVRARLADTERQADLFHELTCTDLAVTGAQACPGVGPLSCRCPAPARLTDTAEALRRSVDACEQRIRRVSLQDPGGLLDALGAEQVLRALALPFELHPGWCPRWYPGTD
ncbi:DUF6221 family protein [Streptomyces sp. NPDC051546]|uniref:DUF6221 family protein n=1 Tax=Streptomyces sp. NPDC051546 TaxID=3365655 RepID=UPI0037B73C82